MSRNDKIGAVILGVLLFAGLFYFIHTTLQNPLPADLGDDAIATDAGDGGDAADNELLPEDTAGEETPAVSTNTATTAEPTDAPPAENKK